MGKIFPKTANGREKEVEKVIAAAIDDAIDFVDSDLSHERQLAEQYYRGRTRLKHEKGRSGVIVTKVRDTIQGIIPSIARVFTQSDQICEFWSDDEEDEAMTKQQTRFCQNIYDRYGGYEAVIGATTDSLKSRVGFIKVSLHKEEVKTPGTTVPMIPQDAMILKEQPNVVINSVEETNEELDGLPVANVNYSKIIKKTKWKLEVRAPETFFINPGATNLDDARIFGFREMVRKYEAVEMGIPKEELDEISASSPSGMMEAEQEARTGRVIDQSDEHKDDPMADLVLVCEAWMRIDLDNDGFAEFVRIITVGDNHKVVQMKECNYHGVAPFYSRIEANDFFPKSMAEDLMQDQDAMTALMRSILDNTALVNSPRTILNDGQVNLEDAKNTEIGAMIRAKNIDQIRELVTPFVAGETLPVLQYLEKISESRSGLTKWSQGIDPDALQSTTRAASLASIQAGDARVEMIARNIGETGIKSLFFAILRTAIYEIDEPQSIRLYDNYEEVDPSKWHDKISVNVNVGLGNGNIESKQMILQQIAAVQQQLAMQFGMTNPISGYKEIRNNLKHQLYLAGIRNINDYFPMVNEQTLAQMDQQMKQAQQGDSGQAAMAQVQAWAAVEREKAQLKLQADMQKMQQEYELKMREMQEKARQEMAKMVKEIRVELEKTYLQDDRERDKNRMDYENTAFKHGLDATSRMRVEEKINADRGYGQTTQGTASASEGASRQPTV